METTEQDSQSEQIVRLHAGVRTTRDSGKTEEGGRGPEDSRLRFGQCEAGVS